MNKTRITQLTAALQPWWDVICAVAGIIIMLTSLIALELKGFHPIYSITLITGLACVLGYLLLRNRITAGLDTDSNKASPYFQKALIVTVALLVAGILAFNLRSEQYVKPLSYYILMALSSGALFLTAAQIRNRTQFVLVIVCACAIGLAHIWTEDALFPDSLLGIDPWHHKYTVEALARGSTELDVKITTLGTFYSSMHLYLRAVMNILPISYKMASLIFAGSVVVVGNIALSGLVGKELFNRRVGAAAAVVVATANWAIFLGSWAVPNSIGVAMSLAAAYLIVMKKRPFWMKDWVVVALVASILLAAYFTHMIAALWVLATIVCLYLAKTVLAVRKILKKGEIADKLKPAATVVLIAMTVISLPVWLISTNAGIAISNSTGGYSFDSSYNYNPSFGMSYATATRAVPDSTPSGTLVDNTPVDDTPAATPAATPTVGSPELLNRNTLRELTTDSAGMILYIALALVGALIMVRSKRTDRWLWVMLSIGILAIGFFPPLFGKSLIEHRWWYFAEVLLSIPLAVALLSVAKGKLKMAATALLVAGIAFLSTIGLPSNNTNRDLSPNLIVRYSFTDKEMQALDQVNMLDSSKVKSVATDPLYRGMIMYNTTYTGLIYSVEGNMISGDFTTVEANVLVLRDSIDKEPLGFGGGTIYKLGAGIIDKAKSQGYTETWSNGEVHILERISP